MKFFDGVKARRCRGYSSGDRWCGYDGGRPVVAATAYNAPFSVAVTRVVATQREWERCVGQLGGNKLLRLLELIEIMLQAPALEARAAIGEHGDHVARFEADVAFAGLADTMPRQATASAAASGVGRGGGDNRCCPARASAAGRLPPWRSRASAPASRRTTGTRREPERQEDREENAFFHYCGTGSWPAWHSGWQRTNRLTASHPPPSKPWRASAWLA